LPNGNPNFATEELPTLEAFFRPLASILERFAGQHNLTIDRYYHQVPAWDFRFRHPKGGEAYIEVRRAATDSVSIGRAWWQDDYERATRSTKMQFSGPVPLDSLDLYATLTVALREVLEWEPGSWEHVHTDYASVWHRTWSKEQFEALVERLPLPVFPDET
jgi:hypothetical protein